MKALVWPASMYDCESWTLRKNEETHLDASEMKGPRKILWALRAAKKLTSGILTKLDQRGNC